MRRHRKEGKKIALYRDLQIFVEHHLKDDQAPEEIAKRLKRIEKYLPYVSAFTIRRYIRSPYGRVIEQHRNKIFNKKKCHKIAARKRIEGKRMISKRPGSINKRWGLGHMEGDFLASGKNGKGLVFALRDRKVRKCLLEKILPVSVRAVDRALGRIKKRYPEMRTLTFDNDLLFLEHKQLEEKHHVRIDLLPYNFPPSFIPNFGQIL